MTSRLSLRMGIGLAAGVVLGVAAIAALVPALRIVRLNPLRALRQA